MPWKSNITSVDVNESYFMWLCGLVRADGPDDYSHFNLMSILYNINFEPIVSHDENRVEDGLELRGKFLEESGFFVDLDPTRCSVLEMLVALAIRIEDDVMYDPEYEDRSSTWFWEMIENLGVDFDDSYNFDAYLDDESGYTIRDIVEEKVIDFVDRNYDKDGFGGLFPLEFPSRDQRNVEIWYQMSEYFLEAYPIN